MIKHTATFEGKELHNIDGPLSRHPPIPGLPLRSVLHPIAHDGALRHRALVFVLCDSCSFGPTVHRYLC